MNLLAIDTAADRFSVALASPGGVSSGIDTWLFEADAGLRHSELILDSIDILFKMAALKPESLDGVICMGGPGSFTGLRIGFSTAKGLALSLGIPLAAIPTLDCMVWPFYSLPGIIVPVLDAKKQAFFCALYRDGKRLCPDMDAPPDAIARIITGSLLPQPENEWQNEVLLVGPGAKMLHEKMGTDTLRAGIDLRWGNAETLLLMAQETDIFVNSEKNLSIGPEYIRKSDAEISGTKSLRQGPGDRKDL
ncbi:MAG: tRNA (adenosine(37)-N6)-threonylcarbamoyltransferase complex dimerization subunit type 1 TsaB [Treponema sp.]|nr:tRNA (adenosine(37)-N6)-threonylcarbamoyltransferase complex dimerization subunit type 1 TsaB [Treponema sp.]